MAEQQTSYVGAMLKSQGNLYALLGAAAVGGALALPFGLAVGAIPLVLFAAGDAIAAMFIPSMPSFRAKVDAAAREQDRAQASRRLLTEISKRVPIEVAGDDSLVVRQGARVGEADRRCIMDYNDMRDSVRSLGAIAADSRTQIGARDIEKLQDATLDYLSLWLARLIIDRRQSAIDPAELRQRVAELDQQIAEAKTSAQASVVRQLQQARNDYAGMVQRQSGMAGRAAAIDAAMLAMPDKIKEVQQLVMAAPFSSGMDTRLEDSLARLRLEEQLEQELTAEIHTEIPDNLLDLPRPARAADARRRAISINS